MTYETEARILQELVGVKDYLESPKTTLYNGASPLTVDALTNSLSVVSTDHNYIHRGLGFSYSVNYTLGNEATQNLYIVAPPATDGYIHLRPTNFSTSESAIQYFMYKDSTVTGGTERTPLNRNYNSSKTAKTKIYDGTPTVTTAGTLSETGVIGSGGNARSRGGGSGGGSDEEIVLEPEKKYLIRLTNLTSAETIATIILFWYEEPDGYINNT